MLRISSVGGQLPAERAHHLSCGHAHSFDRKLPSTHIEQILETWSEEVNDKDIVQALLSKMVYLRDSGCVGRVVNRDTMDDPKDCTNYIRPECGTSDIRREAEVPLPFLVPVDGVSGLRGHVPEEPRTNLMATVCEFSRFVPKKRFVDTNWILDAHELPAYPRR